MSFHGKYKKRCVQLECHETGTKDTTPVMTKTATSPADKPYLDSYFQILSHSDSLHSSASLSSSSTHSSASSLGRKKRPASRKYNKKKMNSEELQHVSDLSMSSESNGSRNSQNNNNNHNNNSHSINNDDDDNNLHDNTMDGSSSILDPQHTTEADRQLHTSESRRSSSTSVRVEVPDIWGDESINFTTSTLRVCKEQVLRPYWGLLVFVGWRGIGKDSVNSHLLRWTIINLIYTTTIIMLLFYTYMYEILACEWNLDIHGKTHMQTIATPITVKPTNGTLTTARAFTQDSKHIMEGQGIQSNPGKLHRHLHQHNDSGLGLEPNHNEGCHHIITTYLIPNLLHLLAYCLGLYYFRFQENEQLYALMEKVFLQATPFQARTASQRKMIVRLRVLLVIGSIWVLFTVFIQCLFLWAFDFPELPLYTRVGTCGYWVMLIMELVGRTVFNAVILAIVMNYVTQCEMIKFYVQGLTTRLLEKSTDLKTAMKDLLTIRHSVSLLNGVMSKMTSLVTFIVAELSIIGLCILIMNDKDDVKVWIYRSLFPFAWMVMLVLPLWQAARVNSIILRIQKISLEMRVFGYKGASILDLDSFLQFVTLIRPKAKLFHLPMLPSYLISAVVLGAFILLLLIQTGSIAIMDFIF